MSVRFIIYELFILDFVILLFCMNRLAIVFFGEILNCAFPSNIERAVNKIRLAFLYNDIRRKQQHFGQYPVWNASVNDNDNKKRRVVYVKLPVLDKVKLYNSVNIAHVAWFCKARLYISCALAFVWFAQFR